MAQACFELNYSVIKSVFTQGHEVVNATFCRVQTRHFVVFNRANMALLQTGNTTGKRTGERQAPGSACRRELIALIATGRDN